MNKKLSPQLQHEIKKIAKSYIFEVQFENNELTPLSRQKFESSVDWNELSWLNILSEDFINYFACHLHWEWISSNQELSEGLIKEFADKIDFQSLADNKHIDRTIRQKIKLLYNVISL